MVARVQIGGWITRWRDEGYPAAVPCLRHSFSDHPPCRPPVSPPRSSSSTIKRSALYRQSSTSLNFPKVVSRGKWMGLLSSDGLNKLLHFSLPITATRETDNLLS